MSMFNMSIQMPFLTAISDGVVEFDQMKYGAFRDGYVNGVNDVVKGNVVVKKTESGKYRIETRETDVTTGTATR